MAAAYRATLDCFLTDESARIVGSLTTGHQHNELQKRQIKAWEREIEVLKSSCGELIRVAPAAARWSLLLEYSIPRRSKRLDAVLLAEDVVFCLEFKTEDKGHSLQPQRQAEDYALDLRDFHEVSRDRRIIPVVVVPKAGGEDNTSSRISSDTVRDVKLANGADLTQILLKCYREEHRPGSEVIDPLSWESSPYRPVPTIIEAAEALFAGHNVREIAHSHAGAVNLTATSDRTVAAFIRTLLGCSARGREGIVCSIGGRAQAAALIHETE